MVFSGRRVFSESFRMMKERVGPLLGIVAVFFVFQIVMTGVVVALFGVGTLAGISQMNPQAAALPAFGVGMIVMLFVFYVVYLLVAFAQYGALSSMASPLQRRSFTQALGDGLRCAPTILGVALLALVGYIVFAIALALVAAALAAVAGEAGSAISLIIALVALVYLASRFVPILPTVAVERIRNPITALIRAWALTRGNVFKIVLVNLAFIVGVVVVFGATLVPFFGMFRQAAVPGSMPNFGSMGLIFLLMLVVGVLMMIFASAFQATIHAELAGSTGEDFAQTFE